MFISRAVTKLQQFQRHENNTALSEVEWIKDWSQEMRNAYKILIGNPEDKRPLGRCRPRMEDNFRMDLRDIWWEDVD